MQTQHNPINTDAKLSPRPCTDRIHSRSSELQLPLVVPKPRPVPLYGCHFSIHRPAEIGYHDMAKNRKQHGSSDRRDRLLGTYGYDNGHVHSTGQPELGEDDVWLTSSASQVPDNSRERSGRTREWAHNNHRQVGGLSLAFDDRRGRTVIHQYRSVDTPNNRHVSAASAPVNVPEWSKMVRVDSLDSMSGSVEFDRDESEWVPPHEYLAREHGRTVTTSVFEGVGRTLKGRDMSRVRDAVWSKTGFFG